MSTQPDSATCNLPSAICNLQSAVESHKIVPG